MSLHFIETVRNPRILEALCRHNADVNSAKTVSGDSSVHTDVVVVHYIMCSFLQETRITPLTVASVFGDLGSVKTLVEHGADPNYLEQQVLLYMQF